MYKTCNFVPLPRKDGIGELWNTANRPIILTLLW